jgi:hypothetical protein
MKELRIQKPIPPNEWLYEEDEIGNRNFIREIILGVDAQPWQECTEEEKQEWINTHKEDYPELFEKEEVTEQ